MTWVLLLAGAFLGSMVTIFAMCLMFAGSESGDHALDAALDEVGVDIEVCDGSP